MNIRPGTNRDRQQIYALIREFAHFQGTTEKLTLTSEQMENDQGLFQCFVAEEAPGELVGFASFFFAYYSWSGKALYLDDLYVTASFRKQGLGRKLLETVIDFARKENCKKLRWQVSRWNQEAIAFYRSIGAAIDEVEINCEMTL